MATARMIIHTRSRFGYLIMEVLVSLAVISVALGAFMGIYHGTRREQDRLKRMAVATLVLHSVLDDLRADRLGSSLTELAWAKHDAQTVAWPAKPVAAESYGAGNHFWQLQAGTGPAHGQLFVVTAIVSWQERGRQREVSAVTQLFVK